ncbi:thioredoxin fold domain-containing protein [Pseudoalteromonas fenneropenaei]|uniref:Thiol:disulfide interchange protein n=1 Tax=Pseudoalteromonas fenneropenaei TaxID=1737459 RepID=A0ABV7CNR0_9GAMM
MKLKLIGSLILASLSLHSYAQDLQDTIADKLTNLTGFEIKSISEHESGLYEIVTDRTVMYSTHDGKHLINGQIHRFENGLLNLTAERKAEEAAKEIARIKPSFVSYKAPNEKYEAVVFFDTTCGFCKKMHREMSQYNAAGITIHYAIWPRQGVYLPQSNNQLYTQSYLNMQSIVCAKNPEMAMNMVMRDETIDKAECKNEIEASYNLGQWLGVAGTPAIYSTNGRLISRGYAPAEELLGMFKGAQ